MVIFLVLETDGKGRGGGRKEGKKGGRERKKGRKKKKRKEHKKERWFLESFLIWGIRKKFIRCN